METIITGSGERRECRNVKFVRSTHYQFDGPTSQQPTKHCFYGSGGMLEDVYALAQVCRLLFCCCFVSSILNPSSCNVGVLPRMLSWWWSHWQDLE
jgi:hypothetical protein